MFRAAMFEQLGSNDLEGPVTTDIAGKSDAWAIRLDREASDDIKKNRLHQKVATTILFESNGGQSKHRASASEIKAAVEAPDLLLPNVDTVLEEMVRSCYYLSQDGNYYKFSLNPNLNKILTDRRAGVQEAAIDQRLKKEIETVFKTRPKDVDLDYRPWPAKTKDVPDRPELTLVVLGPEHPVDRKATKVWMERIVRECGTSGRTMKSALLFAVPEGADAITDGFDRIFHPVLDPSRPILYHCSERGFLPDFSSGLERSTDMSKHRAVSRNDHGKGGEGVSARKRSGLRKMGRVVPVVLICGVLVASGWVLYGAFANNPPPAHSHSVPPPEPGYPRSWEAAIPVSTYSVANARNGNLITTIPIIGWSGKGPDMQMALYHNSANVDAGDLCEVSLGVSLGPGWSMSCSTHIDPITLEDPNQKVVFADDGTQVHYTKQGSDWVAQAGVHDILTEEAGPTWRVTHKDQSYHELNSDGALIKVVDALGYELTITREQGDAHTVITDAAERTLELDLYEDMDVFLAITAPVEEWTPGDLEDRVWLLYHGGNSGIEKIQGPMSANTFFTYDVWGRIRNVTERQVPGEDARTWRYEYTLAGQIKRIVDPMPETGPQLQQNLAYAALPECISQTTYRDRRGANWKYVFDQHTDTFDSFRNPFGHAWTFEYDSDRNRTVQRDPLDNEWTYTYDARGNLLTATDPLLHTQEWECDQNEYIEPSCQGELNRLTSYTDALDNTWIIEYTSANFCTQPTAIIEPETEAGAADEAETILEYHISDEDQPDGMLKRIQRVIDPGDDNDVVETGFAYDSYGHLNFYGEGKIPDYGYDYYTNVFKYTTDSGSRVIGQRHYHGGNKDRAPGAGTDYNDMNQPIGSSCNAASSRSEEPRSVPEGFSPIPDAAPYIQRLSGWMNYAEYNGRGQVKSAEYEFRIGSYMSPIEEWDRTYDDQYNELGLTTSSSITTTEDDSVSGARGFTYVHDLKHGTFTRTGPDGVETFVQTDVAGRVTYLRRGPDGSEIMTALYDYGDNDDGLVDHITYGNNASVWYEYDDARRLDRITHNDSQATPFLTLAYEYTDRDEVARIREYHGLVEPDVVDFTYDNRGRLIREKRTEGPLSTVVYDITYEYDNGGNRTAKEDAVNNTRVEYHYDLEDPDAYDSKNNQLMYYQEFDTTPLLSTLGRGGVEGGGAREEGVLVSTTWYYYTFMGNVERVVTSAKDSEFYESIWFRYAVDDQTATMIIGETWNWNGVDPPDPQSYDITYGREFRYDQARARYLTRVLDPAALEAGNLTTVSKVWSDYDGDVVYGDYTVSFTVPTDVRSYEPGMGKVEPWTSVGATSTSYYSTDMLGSTRYMTTPGDGQGGGGLATDSVTYTAFGERISGTNHRYGYAGAHGYRAQDTAEDPGSDPVPFLHVGHRYYDPATGRFLQRDPIGVWGGLNVYAYVNGKPTIHIDPSGLFSVEKGIVGGVGGGILGLFRGGPAGVIVGVCVGFVVGGWEKEDWNRLKRWWKKNAGGLGGPSRTPVSCFVAGTKVQTPEGEANIESLTVDDRVATYDAETGRDGAARIGDVFTGVATDLVHITIPNETLTCTPEHPFWVIGRGWVAAGRLIRGDALLDIEGQQVLILGVERESLCKPVRIYNITVDECHTYFIGKSKILVHNKSV